MNKRKKMGRLLRKEDSTPSKYCNPISCDYFSGPLSLKYPSKVKIIGSSSISQHSISEQVPCTCDVSLRFITKFERESERKNAIKNEREGLSENRKGVEFLLSSFHKSPCIFHISHLPSSSFYMVCFYFLQEIFTYVNEMISSP